MKKGTEKQSTEGEQKQEGPKEDNLKYFQGEDMKRREGEGLTGRQEARGIDLTGSNRGADI